VSVDPSPSAAAFARQLGLTFPLLGDWPNYEASRAYGTYDEEKKIAARRTFLIDPDGFVRHIIDDPRDFERHSRESLEVLRKLQAH